MLRRVRDLCILLYWCQDRYNGRIETQRLLLQYLVLFIVIGIFKGTVYREWAD